MIIDLIKNEKSIGATARIEKIENIDKIDIFFINKDTDLKVLNKNAIVVTDNLNADFLNEILQITDNVCFLCDTTFNNIEITLMYLGYNKIKSFMDLSLIVKSRIQKEEIDSEKKLSEYGNLIANFIIEKNDLEILQKILETNDYIVKGKSLEKTVFGELIDLIKYEYNEMWGNENE